MTDTSSTQFDPRDLSDQPDAEERLRLLAKYIDDCYRVFKDSKYRQEVLKKIEAGRKNYEQEIEDVSVPWDKSCGLRGPVTALAVDTIEPKMAASLISQDEIVRSDSPEQDPDLEAIAEYDNYWLVHEVRIRQKTGEAMHDLAMDGTVYFMAEWVLEEKVERDFVRQPDPNTGQERGGPFVDGLPTEDYIVPQYEGGKLTHLQFDEVFIPDDVDDEEWDSSPLVRPVTYTWSQLKRFQEQGILGWMNIDDELRAQLAVKREEVRTSAQKEAGAEHSSLDRGIDCLEFHGEFDLDGDGEQERIVAVKPNSLVRIIRQVNQIDLNFKNEKNIKRMTIFRDKGRSYGRGIPHIVSGLQDTFTATIRRIFNAMEIQIDPWGLGDLQSVGFKDQKPQIRPGVLIDCKNPDKVKLVQFPGDATRYIVLIEMVMNLLERSISSPDYTSGGSDTMGVKSSMQTATGTMALISEGNIKHNYKGQKLQDQFLGVLQLLHNLYYQNMPVVVKVEMLGKAFYKQQMALTPKFALAAASSSSNKFIDRQEAKEFNEGMEKFGPVSNVVKLAEDFVQAYGKKNPEQYVDPELGKIIAMMVKQPQLKQAFMAFVQQKMMEAQAAEAMAKAQGGGQGPPPGAGGPPMGMGIPQGGMA